MVETGKKTTPKVKRKAKTVKARTAVTDKKSAKKTSVKKTAKKASVKAASKPRSRKIADKKPGKATQVSPQERYRMIAEAAYLKAEKRSFMPGSEYDDWIDAEREVDAILNKKKLTSA